MTFSRDAKHDGILLYQDADYVDASASFANAAKQNPRDYQCYFYLGASYQALGSYQQAIGAYRSCLDVIPLTMAGKKDLATQYKTLDSLALCIAKGGTCAQEIEAMEKKNAGKASADDQWLLAKVYRYSGDADAAIEAYSKAVLIDRQRFEIAKEGGLYEAALGQNDRASSTLKKAYAVNPDDDQVNDALRKLGVVVGPSLIEVGSLAHM
jgi:tetratricopeptide (TPR) repeat protein